jgi:hypothetical protein
VKMFSMKVSFPSEQNPLPIMRPPSARKTSETWWTLDVHNQIPTEMILDETRLISTMKILDEKSCASPASYRGVGNPRSIGSIPAAQMSVATRNFPNEPSP